MNAADAQPAVLQAPSDVPPSPTTVAAAPRRRGLFGGLAEALAMLILGLLLPGVLLTNAYQSVSNLDQAVSTATDLAVAANGIPAAMKSYESPNDYAMLAITYLETGNQRVMLNKQRMKIAIMNIGFSVTCVGLLLLLIGIDAGGIEIGGAAKELASVNLKVTSSGVAVFVLGAAMAAAGGLLPNDYATVGIPGFAAKATAAPEQAAMSAAKREKLLNQLDACHQDTRSKQDRETCLISVVESQ